MSTATQISPETRRKLLDLIDVIEKVPDEKWDMEQWMTNKGCGTVGCAAYHYVKAHPESELKFGGDEYEGWPEFRGEMHTQAMMDYFGITWEIADKIFFADSYPHPTVARQHVINRIREIIGSEEA